MSYQMLVILVAAMVSGMVLIALSLVIFGILTARSIDRNARAQTENQKWIWTRFLKVLEPHIVEELQHIDEIDAELQAQSEAEPAEAEIVRY